MINQEQHILVLLPTQRDAEALAGIEADFHFHFLWDNTFQYPGGGESFSLISYTQKCENYLENNRIDGLLFSHDFSNLVAGALCDKFGFRGPTLESVFVANHKYYSRSREITPIKFSCLDLAEPLAGQIEHFPCYIKPPYLTLSLYQYKINTWDELLAAVSIIKEGLAKWQKPLKDFYQAFLDKSKFPLITKDILLVEELIESASQHVIEGWVGEQEDIHIWAISDSNYFESHPLAVDNYSTPSRLPSDVQEAMIEMSKQTIARHQLKNTFWNIEMWIKDEKLLITEVNARAASVWHEFYLNTYGKSIYKAMAHLSVGNYQACLSEAPNWSASRTIGAQFHVVTFGEGPANQYFNFEYVKSGDMPRIELFASPGQEIKQSKSSGAWLARFELYGPSYFEITQRADKIRSKLLREPASSPS